MLTLGVNIDHIATVRQARKTYEPDPVAAAPLCELAGARCLTAHLREDRRHIQDRDIRLLKEIVQTKLNLEMANAKEIVEIALSVKPHQATLVPEKREEITTEGGLDVAGHFSAIEKTVKRLQNGGIVVSLFIDPEPAQIKASVKSGATFIEFHTGSYANAKTEDAVRLELDKLIKGARIALDNGLRVNAGHGLNYRNVVNMHKLPGIEELNIGHSIIARAVFVGIERAVREMVSLLENVKY
jgi:pyridoxine 5-phosphate synthase